MTDAETIDRIADYLHVFVAESCPADTSSRTCPTCQVNAKKLLWMVDAYRKVEVA